MSATALRYPVASTDLFSRLVRAGLAVGFSDCFFAVFFRSVRTGTLAFTRVWQGVAATLVGPSAIGGGSSMTALGLLMHFGVAFGWSAVLLAAVASSARLREVLESRRGLLKVAAVMGPVIWMTMSLVVIPSLIHKPPVIDLPWALMGLGHVFFVGLPMAWGVSGRRLRRAAA